MGRGHSDQVPISKGNCLPHVVGHYDQFLMPGSGTFAREPEGEWLKVIAKFAMGSHNVDRGTIAGDSGQNFVPGTKTGSN